MGTRHLICVVQDKQMKVSQYGQWDGYPEGQGADVIKFIRTRSLDKFRKQVSKITTITDAEVNWRWKKMGADDSGFVPYEIADKFAKAFPHLSRDCGADILDYIMKAKQPEVNLDLEFAADSLWCEWVWLINLDTDTLEVYRGSNREPLAKNARFAHLAKKGNNYQPVKLWKKIKFSDLTAKTAQTLQKKSEKE